MFTQFVRYTKQKYIRMIQLRDICTGKDFDFDGDQQEQL